MGEKNVRINVTKSSLPPYEEFIEKIKPIWDTAWLTNMGDLHQELNKKLKNYLEVEQLLLFVNGHMALEMAIQAFNLNGEVITTPFTFASTTHAIVRNNLTPVFCDIKESDYTLNPDCLEALITENTSAIVPVHVYGTPCDVARIQEIADKHHLKVIYDAAHAFGVKVKGKGIGCFGDASMFSFHATKVFNTIEGGAVAFKEDHIKVMLNYLKNFGITGPETVEYVGGNAKMNEFQAAMGLCNLEHLDEELEKRHQVISRYQERLGGVKGLKLAQINSDVQSNYAYCPILFEESTLDRNQIQSLLIEHNIYTRKYFYPLVNDFACYQNRYNSKDTPRAKYIADRILTLPCYAGLEINEVDRICDIILSAV